MKDTPEERRDSQLRLCIFVAPMVSAICNQDDGKKARVLAQSLRERLKIVYSLQSGPFATLSVGETNKSCDISVALQCSVVTWIAFCVGLLEWVAARGRWSIWHCHLLKASVPLNWACSLSKLQTEQNFQFLSK